MCFPYGALHTPNVNGDSASQNFVTRVKQRITQFMVSSEVPEGRLQVARGGVRPRRGSKDTQSTESMRRRVEAKVADRDVRGAVRVLSSDEGFVDFDCAEAVDQLKEKHPPSPTDLDLPAPPDQSSTPADVLTVDQVASAVGAFAAGSSGGLDGLRPVHLQELVGRDSKEAGVRLKSTLDSFCNVVLRGEVPGHARTAFFGASLCALKKSSGGVRPIAAGSVYQDWCPKLLSTCMQEC